MGNALKYKNAIDAIDANNANQTYSVNFNIYGDIVNKVIFTIRPFDDDLPPNEYDDASIDSIPDDTITDIVLKWENLCDACEDLGLEQASLKLEEVFPLLCKKKKTEKLASNETD